MKNVAKKQIIMKRIKISDALKGFRKPEIAKYTKNTIIYEADFPVFKEGIYDKKIILATRIFESGDDECLYGDEIRLSIILDPVYINREYPNYHRMIERLILVENGNDKIQYPIPTNIGFWNGRELFEFWMDRANKMDQVAFDE